MDIDAKELLKKINDSIGSREVFKNNIEDLVSCLIEVSRDINMLSLFLVDDITKKEYVDQYRTILKFIYTYSSFDNVTTMKTSDIQKEFTRMTMEFKNKYSPVRNYLAQCSVRKKEISYDEKKDLYYEKEPESYSNYARVRDKDKIYPSLKYKVEAQEYINHFFNPKKDKIKYFFKQPVAIKAIDSMIEANYLDSEIKGDYDFEDFKYSELIEFCAGLQFIGMFCSSYFIVKNTNYINKEDMVSYLLDLTSLSREKIEFFLDVNTYDYDFQKDKLTLFQSLVLINNKYYFYPITLTIGFLPMKMYRVLCLNKKYSNYQKHIPKIAKLKEEQMTNTIIDVLKKYDLNIESNYIIKDNKGRKLAEFDLLIYDKKENELYVCECKWHYAKDDEKDNAKLDDMLKKEISERKEKNKLLEQNINKVISDCGFNCENPAIIPFLISQNNLGSTKFNMTVVDYDTIEEEIEKYDSFKELMDSIINEKYKEEIKTNNTQQLIELENYRFYIYNIEVEY